MNTKEWIVAGNWKMNLDRNEANDLIEGILAMKDDVPGNVDLIIAPAFPFLDIAVHKVMGTDVLVAAQNCNDKENGAFTGEVSAGMLHSIGVNACIIGHSERRELYGETDEFVSNKVDALLNAGILPIFCCGESLQIRDQGSHFDHVADQIKSALFHLEPEKMTHVVVAYEPIWAIGTGVTASPEQAQEMHAHIRSTVADEFSEEIARQVRLLYGGSCKPENARELFSCEDVNGGLIGGASLNAEDFMAIAKATST